MSNGHEALGLDVVSKIMSDDNMLFLTSKMMSDVERACHFIIQILLVSRDVLG